MGWMQHNLFPAKSSGPTFEKLPRRARAAGSLALREHVVPRQGSGGAAGRMAVKIRRKSPAGTPTNELIFTGYQGTSEDVFPNVLSLYVRPGSKVADVTYGKGVFWK